jgi:hypothetical protein
MVTEGMDRIRGVGKWHFRHAIATSVPDPDRPHRHRSAAAVLMFMDNYSMPMYENLWWHFGSWSEWPPIVAATRARHGELVGVQEPQVSFSNHS